MKERLSYFLTRRIFGGKRPLVPEILGQTDPVEQKRRFSIDSCSWHLSRNTWRKSSINTNSKSTMRFPMSLRWTSYVALKSPKGTQRHKTAFPV